MPIDLQKHQNKVLVWLFGIAILALVLSAIVLLKNDCDWHFNGERFVFWNDCTGELYDLYGRELILSERKRE